MRWLSLAMLDGLQRIENKFEICVRCLLYYMRFMMIVMIGVKCTVFAKSYEWIGRKKILISPYFKARFEVDFVDSHNGASRAIIWIKSRQKIVQFNTSTQDAANLEASSASFQEIKTCPESAGKSNNGYILKCAPPFNCCCSWSLEKECWCRVWRQFNGKMMMNV